MASLIVAIILLISCRVKQETSQTESSVELHTRDQLLTSLLTTLHIDDLEITWEPMTTTQPHLETSKDSDHKNSTTPILAKGSNPKIPAQGKPPATDSTGRLTIRAKGLDTSSAHSATLNSVTDSKTHHQSEKTIKRSPNLTTILILIGLTGIITAIFLFCYKYFKNK